MLRLPKWLDWLLPYQQLTLQIPLPFSAVCQIFQGLSQTGIVYGEPSSLTGYKYKVYFHENRLKIIGPFGNRRWTLLTDGQIHPDLNDQGTVLALRMRLANRMFMQVGFGIFIYIGFVTWMFRAQENLPTLFFLVVLQISVIAYAATLIAFRIEARHLINLLKQKLGL